MLSPEYLKDRNMDHHPRNEIAALLEAWMTALETRDPIEVAALYAEDAVLLPTVSNEVRKTPAAVARYFDHFLQKLPKGQIIQQNIRLFDGLAINSGIYSFNLTVDGVAGDVLCRFTFVYRRDPDGGWKIIEHHSSVMPE